jgi:pilus assembly protein Flp/PilA
MGDGTMTKLQRLWAEESGATAVEYGLMVAAIAAVIITVVFSVGTKVQAAFNTVDSNM